MRVENIGQRLKTRLLEGLSAAYNKIVIVRATPRISVDSGPLNEINAHAKKQSDISDHLITLFVEAAALRPSMIVELGVRSGESTVALSRVADLFGSHLISVDLEDCSRACSSEHQVFVKTDDVTFAKEFTGWCDRRNCASSIDVLFIDTSHELDHTVAEIQSWFPLLSPHCKVIFHDTNMGTVYIRRNRTTGVGWANNRGVIAAIEQYFGCQFDERHDFVHFTGGWIIKHSANCNGFTVLERVCPPSSDQASAEADRDASLAASR
jgi:cephalosporin hydroxylase